MIGFVVRPPDCNGIHVTVCVEESESPVATSVAHRAGEVEPVIERQLIVVDPCLQR